VSLKNIFLAIMPSFPFFIFGYSPCQFTWQEKKIAGLMAMLLASQSSLPVG